MKEKSSSRNEEGIYEPFSCKEVPWVEFSKGERFGIRFRRLGEYGGCSHVGVCLEELLPGKQTYPPHYHMLEEEHLLMLEGKVTLHLGDRSYEMSEGDYVCFPAGQKAAHTLVNNGTERCRYLIIGERNPNEVIVYPEAGRIGVRSLDEGFRSSETMDYWDDVET